MTDTANLGLPFIDGSQAQKHITHNEALRILDSVIQIGVLDVTRTTPPSTPAEGERHVVATGASGAWAEQAGKIATYEDATWRFLMPKLGWCVWSAADNVLFVYDSAHWRDLRDLPLSLDSVAHLGINSTASSPNLLNVKSNAALFSSIAVADGGTGHAQLQISKESSSKTASVIFSDNFSGRAEFGLVGSDAFKLKVSSDGSTFVEAFNIDQATGNLTLPRGVLLTGVLSPSQITSNQNDYAPSNFATAHVLRISTDASRNITGLAGGAEGRAIYLVNAGSNPAVLKDESTSSTAANRFAFGSDMTLAAKQGATLIYDGNASRWRQVGGPASSSGSGGATDSERQNFLLTLIYQSKSFAEYRRLVNVFASGFKGASDTLNGILTASSSNYNVVSASGYVAPTSTSGSAPSYANTGGTGARTGSITTTASSGLIDPGYPVTNIVDGSTGSNSTNSSNFATGNPAAAAAYIRFDFGSGASKVITEAKWYQSSSVTHGSWKWQGSNNGSSWTDIGSAFTLGGATTQTQTELSTNTAGYRYYQLLGVSGNVSASPYIQEIEFKIDTYSTPSTSNMTLVTALQTADASVSYGRVLIEYDNTAAPTLNTDLTIEISCDGGSHWTAASLSTVTSYSGGSAQRKVAETVDQSAGAYGGTSFAARIKTLNNKNVPIYGVNVMTH